MKTRRIARSGERTFSKKWENERNLQANLEEYDKMSSTNNCPSFKHSEIQ